VDVACDRALARGAQVIFVDNRAVALPGEPDLGPALTETIELAMERTTRR
jgi:hypothetical protein